MKTLKILQKTGIVVALGLLMVMAAQLFNFSSRPEGDCLTEELSGNCHKPMIVPGELDFSGEVVPLKNFDVFESLDREIQVNSFWHSQTIYLIKKAPRYFSIIEPILKEEGIPEDFKYLAVAESGLNEKAVSPSEAIGLWQFMKGTAKDYGLKVNEEVDERYHIEKSTRAACQYLKDSYEEYGSWTLVAASYNAGRNHINEQLERQKTNNYYDLLLGEETARYVFRILALKLVLQNPCQYGFQIPDDEKYPLLPTRTVKINKPVTDFADFAKTHKLNYKLLKYLNPWLRQAYLTNKQGKTYEIKLLKKGFRSIEDE